MIPQVEYGEFKVLETNVRECFDAARRLAADIRAVNALLNTLAGTVADLSRRLARVEDRLHAPPSTERGGI